MTTHDKTKATAALKDLICLLEWYEKNQRSFPWRQTREAYRIWVSEVMLQQTQTGTVIPYYERFLRRFPSLATLAAVELEVVLKLWEGLGYYSRARHLHRASQVVMHQHDGLIPKTFAELKKLPGLGDYTAAAIASIAWGQPVPAVDGNVLRVFARYWGIHRAVDQPDVRRRLFNRLQAAIIHFDPSHFNQSIMDLGATICTPRLPRCPECPLQRGCAAFAKDWTAHLPIKRKRKSSPHFQVAAGIIRHQDRILMVRRQPEMMLGGLWEFPSVRMESLVGNAADYLAKWLREKTGLPVRINAACASVNHSYSHFKITLTAYSVTVPKTLKSTIHIPVSEAHWQWLDRHEIDRLPCDKATLKIIAELEKIRGE